MILWRRLRGWLNIKMGRYNSKGINNSKVYILFKERKMEEDLFYECGRR